MPKSPDEGSGRCQWRLIFLTYYSSEQLGTHGLPGAAGTASLECAQRPSLASFSEHLWAQKTECEDYRCLIKTLPLPRAGGKVL